MKYVEHYTNDEYESSNAGSQEQEVFLIIQS